MFGIRFWFKFLTGFWHLVQLGSLLSIKLILERSLTSPYSKIRLSHYHTVANRFKDSLKMLKTVFSQNRSHGTQTKDIFPRYANHSVILYLFNEYQIHRENVYKLSDFLYLHSGMPHRSAIFRLLTPGPVLLFRQNYSFNGQNIDTVIDIIHIIIHFILNDRRSTVCLTIRQKIGLTYQPVSHKSVRISLFMAMDIFHHCCLPQTLVRMAICLDLTNLQPIWGKNTRSHCTSVPFFMPSRYFFELKWLERK